jgi:hypothetical protein
VEAALALLRTVNEMNKIFGERLGHALMYTQQPGTILQDFAYRAGRIYRGAITLFSWRPRWGASSF